MSKIDFYFDFLSPFSFFAWKRFPELKSKLQVEVSYKPALLGVILNHHGQKGPAEIDPKREYLFKTCLRYAKQHNFTFLAPKTHPFNPLYALRLATKECSGDLQEAVINTLWVAGWEKGIDLGNPDELGIALKEAGLPAAELLEKTYTKEVKQALKNNTDDAIKAGAFGVPTFIVDNKELFWGNDSLLDLTKFLKNEDDLDQNLFREILNKTPKAQSQKLNF